MSPARVAGGCEEVRAVLRFDPFRDLDRMTEQLLGVPSGTGRTPRPEEPAEGQDVGQPGADTPGKE